MIKPGLYRVSGAGVYHVQRGRRPLRRGDEVFVKLDDCVPGILNSMFETGALTSLEKFVVETPLSDSKKEEKKKEEQKTDPKKAQGK